MHTHHTYNNLNKQPKGGVIVLVIPTTFTIVLIKKTKGIVIVLVIPTTLIIILINNQKVFYYLSYTYHIYNNLNRQPTGTVCLC